MELPEVILFCLEGLIFDTEVMLADAWSETAKNYNHYLTKKNYLN